MRRGTEEWNRFSVWVTRVFSSGVLVTVFGAGAPALLAQQPVAVAQPSRDDVRDAAGVLARPISVTLTHVSLKRAIDSLSHLSNVLIQYRASLLKSYQTPVTLYAVDMPLGIALEHVLDGTNLRTAPDGRGNIAIIGTIHEMSDSTPVGGTITGRVTDSLNGRALGGATVKIVGTKISALTSDSGRFTLHDVPVGDQVLSVRVFGYRFSTRTITVEQNAPMNIRIAITPAANVLSGVVTTATGVQRKIEVGNDITTLNVDSIRQVAPIHTVTDLLETRVPGLTVLHSSGAPGDPSRLRLRGAGSIQLNNDPIIIIDGIRAYSRQSDARNNNLSPGIAESGSATIQGHVGGYAAPSPLDQIDPASIETIEVLKGPSATATYGSDAANGVIVITTKHGHAGPTQWSLALADGISWSPGNWPVNFYRFGYDGTKLNAPASVLCSWYQRGCNVDSVVAFQALNDSRYTVFGHGSNQEANLTVSGGTPTLTYSLTGSSSRDVGLLTLPAIERQRYDSAYGPIPEALVHPDKYSTWGVDGSVTALPTTMLRVTLHSSLVNSLQQRSSLDNGVSQLAGRYISPILLDGPIVSNEVERATANAMTSANILSLHWQLRPWLPLDATGGLSTVQRVDNTYVPYGVDACGVGGVSVYNSFGNYVCGDTTGSYGVGRGTARNQTLTIGSTVPLRLITLALGGNLYSESTADFQVATNQLAPGVSVPTTFRNRDGTNSAVTSSTFGQSTYGWYIEPRLNIQSRFFVTPGFRLDGGSGGSTSSGSVGGLSTFPKLNFSYLAIDRQGERPFWGVLTQLRPRLSFGLAGTQPLPQDRLRLFNVGSYGLNASGGTPLASGSGDCQSTLTLDGVTTVPAVCLNGLGNTQLRPERTREIEGGFDATLWRNRLSITYTRYDKTTQDAVQAIPIAGSVAGGWNIQKNIGEIRNTGTEMQIDATVLESRALSWNIGANLSNDNSLVVRLNPGQPAICFGPTIRGACNGTRIIAGYPLFGEWAQPIASFADANHDAVLEPSEIRYVDSAVYVGQPTPKYQLNVNTTMTVLNGRLSATATFAYQNGLTQNNVGACQSGAFDLLPNVPGTPLATQAAIVASGCRALFANSYATTQIGLIQTVNTFRFNSLSINYVAPRAMAMWFHASHVTVALQGSNLALHTNYRGIDPNVNAFSTVNSGDETADLGQIPEPRTWQLRFSVGN